MGLAMTKPPAPDSSRPADQGPCPAESATPDALPRAIPLPVDWRDLSDRLRRYALALTRRDDEADDLVQHTLATLLARAPDKAGHLGYARTTLTRAYLDRERSLKRRLARTLAIAWQSGGATGARSDDSSSALHEAIDALPARQRAALVLRLVEELDYPQIAAALECSPEAVRSNLHLARAAVRRSMSTSDHQPPTRETRSSR